MAEVVGLALRGKDVDNLRWRELRASVMLGLGMLPDAPKSGRFALRRGEPRAAPHVTCRRARLLRATPVNDTTKKVRI